MRIRTFYLAILLPMLCILSGCSRFRPPPGVQPVAVSLLTTGYCKCGICCSWHRNWLFRPVYSYGAMQGKPKIIGQTASGAMAGRGTIAADTSLYPFGTIMYIEGYGYGKVQDRGGDIKGQHVDLYFRTHQQALEWGKQTKKVKVWFPAKTK